jgi:hypothetical protein
MDAKSIDTHAVFDRSRDAFLRDLPSLLANPKYDRWSAVYLGDERIALVKTLDEAMRICLDRGQRAEDCFIGCVTPQGENEEEIEGGLSFIEFDDERGTFSGPSFE